MLDIADLSRVPLKGLATILRPYADGTAPSLKPLTIVTPEKAIVTRRVAEDLLARNTVLLDLGLGYLTLERSTPTLSPGELQRLRLATQMRSNLFGVVYVLDEPSAGLHPADVEKLLAQLDGLVEGGNTVVAVEHDLHVAASSDWVIDVGPGAGDEGGRIAATGTPAEVARARGSRTAPFLAAAV